MSERPARLAIVLSGGGARGAYEVGVLSYLFEEIAQSRGRDFQVDIICGTSVGAINATHLASHMSDPRVGMQKLTEVWQGLKLDSVLSFGVKQALALTGVFRAGAVRGLVDVKPLTNLINQSVPWRQIKQSLNAGHLRALTISCTEVMTGRTVQFCQTGPETGLPRYAPPRTLMKASRIGPQHVLASASIPLLFPPVRVGKQLYIDGGLRQNTPVSPALRFGASHIFVIGTSVAEHGVIEREEKDEPTTAYVVGKIMDALLLDHLSNDVAQVRLVNDFIKSGEQAFGSEFVERINQAAVARGGRTLNPARLMMISPSTSLGALGAQYLRTNRLNTKSAGARKLLEWLDSGSEADLASYLLFDGGYSKKLIELGRADARAARERIVHFLENIPERGTNPRPREDRGPGRFTPPAVG